MVAAISGAHCWTLSKYMESWNQIVIAVIGGIVSIYVANMQAKNISNKKSDETVRKAEDKAESKTNEILHNGVYKEMREKAARQQLVIEEQARALTLMGKRIDDVLPVYIERDQLLGKLAKAEKALQNCLAREAKL